MSTTTVKINRCDDTVRTPMGVVPPFLFRKLMELKSMVGNDQIGFFPDDRIKLKGRSAIAIL